MCLAFPVRVAELLDGGLARIELEGVSKVVSVVLVEEVDVGDFVILHAGFALSKLDPEEAMRTLSLFAEMAEAAT